MNQTTKQPMQVKQATRIQTSVLNGIEKKVLVKMANHLPSWVTSDMLTLIGVFGALLTGTGFVLTYFSYQWLWLSSLGLIINWFGDSLDGTLARVRNTQRPIYGYYLDHNTDLLCQLAIFGGIGLSPMMNMGVAMLVLVMYLMLEVYVSINAHLKSEFRLTYAKMGPTEFRLLVIILNTIIICSPHLQQFSRSHILLGVETTCRFMDYVGCIVAAIMFIMYLVCFIKDARYFAKIDPLKKNEEVLAHSHPFRQVCKFLIDRNRSRYVGIVALLGLFVA